MGIYSYSNETSFKIKYWGSRLEEKSLQKQRPFLLLQRSKASSKSTIGKQTFDFNSETIVLQCIDSNPFWLWLLCLVQQLNQKEKRKTEPKLLKTNVYISTSS